MLRVGLKRLPRDRKHNALAPADRTLACITLRFTTARGCVATATILGVMSLGCHRSAASPGPSAGVPGASPAARSAASSQGTAAVGAPSASAETAGDAEPPTDQGPALSRLLSANWSTRTDRLGVIALPMPDAAAWTRVRYWGVTTLVGFRFGAAHHVAAAAFVFPQSASEPGAAGCARRFRAWAEPLASDWGVSVGPARVDAFEWLPAKAAASTELAAKAPAAPASAASPAPSSSPFGERHVFDVERRSLFGNTKYACAFAAYAAWPEACLVVGFAVPEQHVPAAARALRQRLARDALPAVNVRHGAGAEALKNKTDIGS